ncbi:class I SAM-dependent methyltransferase [Wenzhouxiangella sp. XN79A]|nr:class I SAM-dependent methyltransferase [Wenzhouxiangella sp. XN79A]
MPNGRLLAIDSRQEMLGIIDARKRKGSPDNIETVPGSITDPGLPPGAVDLFLLADAYHEFSHPFEVCTAMVDALKPGGTLVPIESRAADPFAPIKPLCKRSEAPAVKEMGAAGRRHLRTEDVLPQKNFMVFEKPAGAGRPDRSTKQADPGEVGTTLGRISGTPHNKTPVFWNRGLSADNLRLER